MNPIIPKSMQAVLLRQLGVMDLQSTVQKRLPLSAVQQAMEIYQYNMTAGKILLVADPEKVSVDEW